MKVLKKNGTYQKFDPNRIKQAIKKASKRCLIPVSQEVAIQITTKVEELADTLDTISVHQIQDIVVKELTKFNPSLGEAYNRYRNYKIELSAMFDEVYNAAQQIRFVGDTSNANSDASLVSTRRALTYDALNRKFYRKFFLNAQENQAMIDGYIYAHDQNARLDTMNCCIFDMATVLKNGFVMGNIHYNEPKSLDVAFGVLGDVILACASQQYGRI